MIWHSLPTHLAHKLLISDQDRAAEFLRDAGDVTNQGARAAGTAVALL